jgi:hypothetical protein
MIVRLVDSARSLIYCKIWLLVFSNWPQKTLKKPAKTIKKIKKNSRKKQQRKILDEKPSKNPLKNVHMHQWDFVTLSVVASTLWVWFRHS